MFDSYVSLPDGKKRFNKHLQIFGFARPGHAPPASFQRTRSPALRSRSRPPRGRTTRAAASRSLGWRTWRWHGTGGRWGWVGCGDLNCLNIYIYVYIYICWTLFDSVWHCTTKNKGFSNETPKHILKRKRTTTYWQHMMKIIWYPWLQTLQHLQWTSGG